jgi:hypothetical protein
MLVFFFYHRRLFHSYEVHWARAAVAIIESRMNAAAAGLAPVQPLQVAVEELLACDAHCCKKRLRSAGGLRPAVVLALKLRRWVSEAHKWNTQIAAWLRQNASVRNSDALAALLAKVPPPSLYFRPSAVTSWLVC